MKPKSIARHSSSLAAIAALIAVAMPMASHAAPVTWGSWTAVTNNTAIQTTAGYTTYGGVNFNGSTTTINNGPSGSGGTNVVFTGIAQNASGTAAGITVGTSNFLFQSTGTGNSNVTSAVGSPQTWTTVLDRVIGDDPTSDATINLSGLTNGSQYYVQFFSSAPDANILQNLKITSGAVQSAAFGTHSGGGTKYIIASFTAGGATQSFSFSGSGEPTFSALVIGVQPAASGGTVTATGSLSPFTTNVGTASAAQSTVSVSGTGLTANITATAPSGFEVSSTGSGYANTATFTQSAGNVASTPLYVRLTAAAAIGAYSGNVVLSSTGSTSFNVAASGTVYPPLGDGTWILNGNGDWSNNANWSGNQIADAVGGTANFTTAFGGNRNVTLDSSRTLGILNLSVTGGALNILSSGPVLTLDNTGSTAAQINMTTAQNMALGTLPLELKDSLVINQNISNGTGKALTLGTISSTNGSLTIQHNSTLADGQTNFDGIISNGSGSIAFTQTSGRSIFNAVNTYTGATTLNGGTLKLSVSGALDSATSVSIAAGATLDLTAATASSATYLWNATSLSASGAATPATISGTAGGTIDMGVTPISLTTNGTNPCLTVTNAALTLGGNQFTVVTGSPLSAGVYTLVSAASITGSVNSTALYGGSGLAGGASGAVSISGNNVIITVTGGATVGVTGSLTAFTTTAGTASAAQTVSVSGTNLSASIIATAPSGFEVSSDGTAYASTATYTQSGGNASGTLYVRFSAAATAGSYTGNVIVTSTGANTVNVAASGTVYPTPGDGTWTLNGDGNWSDYANWSGNVIADGVGKSGTFTLALTSSNKTITLDSNRTLGIWNLGQSGRSLNFVPSGGSVLTLDNTGSTNAVINVANGGRNIAAGTLPIELMDSVDIASVLVSGSSLTLGPITVKSGASNSGNLTVTNNSLTGGNPTTVFGGAISDGAGTISLVNTAGFISLSAANSYTGATTINGGTLRLGANDVLPNTSNVSIGSATLNADVRTDTAGTLDVTGSAVINLGTGAALAFANSSAVSWTGGTLNVTGTLGATSLRFGTTSGGLTSTQLALISVNGSGAGTYALDANGYLVLPGYATWAGTHAGGGTASADFDNDGVSNGVEYFMNITTPGFTANPALNGANTITWPNGGNIPPSAYGTQYVVQTSGDLVTWTDVASGSLTTNSAGPAGSLTYILTGTAPRFVRLKVTPN